jgi:hypothetical protein
MVDVDDAMRTSAYSGGGKRRKKSDADKREEKQSRVIEPFHPAEHALKEKGEAISMWIVVIYGVTVCVLMRYVFMPTLPGPERVLWLLPMLLAVTVPPLHRVLMPSEYYDMFTMSNWFRACFLFVFSWLALSFLLVNPPMADIAAPAVGGGLDIEITDGVESSSWRKGTYTLGLNQDTVDVVLGMGVRDNIDAANATMVASVWYHGELLKDSDGLVIGNLANGTVASHTEAIAAFDAVNGNWTRGDAKNSLTGDSLGPKVTPRAEDIGLAWDLGELGPGEYTVQISLVEDGAPWSTGQNSWSAEYTLVITQIA